MNSIASWINDVIRLGPAPLLKRLGFKKSGRRFAKENAESVSRIEFQGSQWNHDAKARFTLNISVHFPCLELASEDLSPQKAFTRSMASVGARIGHLMPSKEDYWWAITTEAGHPAIAMEVSDALERFALPYLERISTMQGLAEHGGYNPLIGKFPSLAVASALAVLGRRNEAMAIFLEYTANRSTLGQYEKAWLEQYGHSA